MNEEDYKEFDLQEHKPWYPSWYHKIAIKTLSTNALPKHIGIIMDGNRRWARERGFNIIDGHIEGVKAFDSCVDWLQNLGIKEVTAYAFSIDNFKRDKTEVKQLMRLIKTYLQRKLNQIGTAHERGRRYVIYGNIDLLPQKLKILASKLMLQTVHNKLQKVNIAICYKASDEIDNVVEALKTAVGGGELLPEDINESLIDNCLCTGDGECPDLLIRTSGEQRYSDFYMWQLMRKPLFFCTGNWPDFSFIMLLRAVFMFQRNFANTKKAQEVYDGNLKNTEQMITEDAKRARDYRVEKFLANRKHQFVEYLTSIVNGTEEHKAKRMCKKNMVWASYSGLGFSSMFPALCVFVKERIDATNKRDWCFKWITIDNNNSNYIENEKKELKKLH